MLEYTQIVNKRVMYMKIKTVKKSYDEVAKISPIKHDKPAHPSFLFRTLVRVLSIFDLMKVKFKWTGRLPKKENGPSLILMNHSSFLDLKIAHKILYPRKFAIICAHDALVGKRWLMRRLGCVPTKKFVSDLALIHDISDLLSRGISVLMYPEAGYSLDGTTTVLPSRLGGFVKMLGVPVTYIETRGSFGYQPLYNELRIRRTQVTAHVSELISKEETQTLDAETLMKRISTAFSFDAFKNQSENRLKITEPTRAIGLEKILYRCPHCQTDGTTVSTGARIICTKCDSKYQLNEYGELVYEGEGEGKFRFVSDWFRWQRECVREEILADKYNADIPVSLYILKDYKAFYEVGVGMLKHTPEGFHLIGCEGKVDFTQKALSTYGLNVDLFFYEIGDVVSIGNHDTLYYLFPKNSFPVVKLRLATEELYKLHHDRDFHLKYCGNCDHSHHD